MASGIKLQGARMDQLFRSISRSVARDALREGVLMGGEIVAADARRRAPRVTGTLAASIDVRLTKSGFTRARSVVATTDEGYYGAFIEYGFDVVRGGKVVGHVPGRPFMRPAFDANQGRVEEVIGSSIRRAIERAVT